MVFVWSHLSDGDPAYTLVQVSVNDLIMLVAFAPIVKLPGRRAPRASTVPFSVLLYSVLVFVVVPLVAGLRRAVRSSCAGRAPSGSTSRCCPPFQPVTIVALLATLVAHLRVPGREHHLAARCTWC